MTVLVCSTKSCNKSFALTFQNDLKPDDVKKMLKQNNPEAAIRMLITRSSGVIEVIPENRKYIEHAADFVINDSYTSERLA